MAIQSNSVRLLAKGMNKVHRLILSHRYRYLLFESVGNGGIAGNEYRSSLKLSSLYHRIMLIKKHLAGVSPRSPPTNTRQQTIECIYLI
jgi:hypothetical protein